MSISQDQIVQIIER
ncbi:hypothetical protein PWW31_20050 [Vibrio harveyi]|nr:hypothetical protein PWW31_20050 [Vibrio harveyi]